STRFWVVRAQVSAGGVSGLETVLSGAYIAVDPSDTGRRTRRFEGLSKAPIVTSDEPGTLFSLRAEELGSIQVGSPVYYRWLRVGQVAGYSLDENGRHVDIQVFVESPHDQRVRSTTRFWNASGLDFALTAEGLQIDTPSIVAMAVGGIAFETPPTVTVARDVAEDMVFELYPNKQAIRRPRYAFKQRFLLHFDESIAGLVPGSPVQFRGFKLGEVLDVDLRLDPRTNEIEIPVVIEIEPERMGLAAGDPDAREGASGDVREANLERIEQLVARGLRARLVTGNLLTGQKAVEFDFVASARPARVASTGTYPELPTAHGGLEAITDRIASIVDKVDRLPLESIGRELERVLTSLSSTLGEMERLAGTANDDLVPGLVSSLAKLEEAIGSADALISPDSNTARDVEQLVRDLSKAAQSLRLLTERLEQHPEELLRGKR
ncbi:MAG TPA: MlaD family protein, partial [Myxococcota bacterium]|nr:MlaD family protein [Myxococcota bacterium]